MRDLTIRVLNANVSLEVPLQIYLERTDLWNDLVRHRDLETFQADESILFQHTYVILRGLEKKQQRISRMQSIDGQRQNVQIWFETTAKLAPVPKVPMDKKGAKPKIRV